MGKYPAAQEILPISFLKPTEVFSRIRNFLAGRHVGATRDAALLDQVLLCLFAKLYLTERQVPATDSVQNQYVSALKELEAALPSTCLPGARLSLDATSLEYVDRCLASLDFASGDTDLIGDAYQCFNGADSRGQQGQFFTPAPAIRILVSCVDPLPGERVIDPAAGAGGFLVATARHLAKKGATKSDIGRSLFGVEKDAYLARLARMRVSLLTFRTTNVTAGDSLSWKAEEPDSFLVRSKPGAFDVVLTNPPFGSRIVAATESVRRQFKLAHKWLSRPDGTWAETSELALSSPPQVLFIERCLSLVRPGGRVGIVVPESLVSGNNYRYVLEFIRRLAVIEAVIGMPEALFKTSGRGGTHTKTVLLFLRKIDRKDGHKKPLVFMAEARWCGHDSRGRSIPNDDTTRVIENWRIFQESPRRLKPSWLGFAAAAEDLRAATLAPRAHDPEVPELLRAVQPTHHLIRFGDLVRKGTVQVSTGDEVGKLAYGTGDVPFVRTSDLSNWEIKVDPKHLVSREIYEAVKGKQDVQPGDILMVRDGTYLIGTCAMVSKHDRAMVLQSHIYRIRVRDDELIDPFLLLAILSSPLVQRQIKALSQAQDVMNSLGSRINEIALPIPRSDEVRRETSELVQRVVRERAEARELCREVMEKIASPNQST